jgi:hypothetical protein
LSNDVLGGFIPELPIKTIYLNKDLPPKEQPITVAHEGVHRTVAGQFPKVGAPPEESQGDAQGSSWKFDELVGNKRARYQVANALTSPEVIAHFANVYGLDTEHGYINEKTKNDPRAKTADDREGQAGNLFHEIAAELSAIQQVTGKFVVDDPFLREKVFNTPEKRAAMDAVISRITRTDSKDAAPFTANYAGAGATDPKERNFLSGLLESVRDDFYNKYEVSAKDMTTAPVPPKKYKRSESF